MGDGVLEGDNTEGKRSLGAILPLGVKYASIPRMIMGCLQLGYSSRGHFARCRSLVPEVGPAPISDLGRLVPDTSDLIHHSYRGNCDSLGKRFYS